MHPTGAPSSTERTITRTWLVLVAITIGSWWLAPAHIDHTVSASTPLTALVLVLAWVKSRLIIEHFMEVHSAPRWLRRTTDAWLATLFTAVFVIYLL